MGIFRTCLAWRRSLGLDFLKHCVRLIRHGAWLRRRAQRDKFFFRGKVACSGYQSFVTLCSPRCASECEAQRELHEARRGERRIIFTKCIRGLGKRRLGSAHVVAHGVGQVERLPSEL